MTSNNTATKFDIDDLYTKINEISENVKITNNIIVPISKSTVNKEVKGLFTGGYIRKVSTTLTNNDMVLVNGLFPSDTTSFQIVNNTAFEILYNSKKDITTAMSLPPLSSIIIGVEFSQLFLQLQYSKLVGTGTFTPIAGNLFSGTYYLTSTNSNIIISGTYTEVSVGSNEFNITGVVNNGLTIKGTVTVNLSNGTMTNQQVSIYNNSNQVVGIAVFSASATGSGNLIFTANYMENSTIDVIYTNSTNPLALRDISYGSTNNLNSKSSINNVNNLQTISNVSNGFTSTSYGTLIMSLIGTGTVATITYKGEVSNINGGNPLTSGAIYQFRFAMSVNQSITISGATISDLIFVNNEV